MRYVLLFWLVLFFTCNLSLGQESFLGIQNSQRKGMINALMNPAELNNLNKKVEVSFFAVGEALDNNILSFQDIISDPGQWETLFQSVSEPVNLRTDFAVLGPSVGIRFDKWSLGFTSQLKGKVDVIDFNPDLGDAIVSESTSGSSDQIQLDIPYNQRINAVGWMELGVMAGTSIWKTESQSLSLGSHFKLLFPGTYANLGMDEIQATLLTGSDQIRLTDARGNLNLSYDDRWDSGNGLGFDTDLWRGFTPKGFALDLGVNYLLKRGDKPFVNLGLSMKNMGGMTTTENQTTRNYTMNIPQNESFRIDNLEGSAEEIEQQLVDSGYFTIARDISQNRIHLPQLLAAYVEFSPVRQFQVSLYAQKRIQDENRNSQLSTSDLLVLTPRFIAGKLELYSPWMQHQVSGLTGGLGIQYGGFFLGSQSILTGLLTDSNRLDVHMGLSWGF
ncbi:DUF5723 family protein [Cyclobacterium jeungdonense]|uniref:DUF5723 domain-containing protein n=1 Tax=Cyclobacterium jeungdonense TaxID=708087 RepID=A0ABT8CCT0_9BACT|nr:hypothetical protein [Cyclobacterium jeungdonense]MDN3690609.1 hypothetical protein [Cyclobacterium jeungdonense]